MDLFVPPASSLTPTSAENAVQAMGAIRAALATESIDVSPMILQFYGDPRRYMEAQEAARALAPE